METGRTGGRPDELRAEALQLRDAVTDLVAKVDVAQRQTKLLRRLTLGVIALAVVAVITGGIFGFLLFQQVQKTNAFLAEGMASRGSIALIRDCIDPAGVCAKRQRASTAKVIGQIIDANHNGKVDTQEILDALKGKQERR